MTSVQAGVNQLLVTTGSISEADFQYYGILAQLIDSFPAIPNDEV